MPETSMDVAALRAHNQDRIRELFTHLFEWASAGDMDRIRDYYTDDTVLLMPQMDVRSQGIDNILSGVESVPRNFSRWSHGTFTFHDMLDPDEVIWEADADAVFRHSGEPYNQRYVLFCRMREGRIAEYTEYVDTRELSKFPPQEQ
jgi:ketosteroid isomerase-like protein